MGVSETATLAALKAHRALLIDPLIAAHKGKIVKTTGDGLLLTFPSIDEAVSCALAVQSGMARRNQNVPVDVRIEFRVGINLGDVIFEKGDVFGDGVNIAARLEQIAPPGGICMSEDAYRQVRGKLQIAIADIGEQMLKNISAPVRVYRVEPSVAAAFESASPVARARPRLPAAAAWAGTALLAVAALAAIVWLSLPHAARDPVGKAGQAKAIPATTMPVIAVLPFANQTGEEAQEYFADGVTEEVINALGRFNTLRVIGRNAVLAYKKRP